MNAYRLRDDLQNTIKNKRELLVAMSDKSSEDLVAQFLRINIDELERILDYVKICCEQSPIIASMRYPLSIMVLMTSGIAQYEQQSNNYVRDDCDRRMWRNPR